MAKERNPIKTMQIVNTALLVVAVSILVFIALSKLKKSDDGTEFGYFIKPEDESKETTSAPAPLTTA